MDGLISNKKAVKQTKTLKHTNTCTHTQIFSTRTWQNRPAKIFRTMKADKSGSLCSQTPSTNEFLSCQWHLTCSKVFRNHFNCLVCFWNNPRELCIFKTPFTGGINSTKILCSYIIYSAVREIIVFSVSCHFWWLHLRNLFLKAASLTELCCMASIKST